LDPTTQPPGFQNQQAWKYKRATGLIGRYGDNAGCLLCASATGDHDLMTEVDTTHTSSSTGLHDLRRTNSFITGTLERHALSTRTDRQIYHTTLVTNKYDFHSSICQVDYILHNRICGNN